MTATPVILVLHNHQPVGNFPWVIAECFHTAYAPMLTLLEQHPRMRIALHFTGPLLEWLQAEQPAYLHRVRALVARGQVEVLGGGFYEPILSVIPHADRDGQLAMMRDTVTDLFGHAPEGIWLAERIWEPELPTPLTRAGARYVLIDDEAWLRLGYSEARTRTMYVTEDQGAAIKLLPINRQLRYTLPTAPVEEVLHTMRAMVRDGADVLVYGEDGERYGNWPGTYDYLYGDEAYVARLFTALCDADDFEFVLPGAYARTHAPAGRVYLPPSSYAEMLGWAGGFWRNFLTRYPESNLMHKKMYQVSQWLAQARAGGADVTEAERDLYAAQCNCPYWHGTFGGLYLPHLRRATYAHLLRAEDALRPVLPLEARPDCAVYDFDLDGHDEIILRDGAVSVGIAPAQGGGVFALEHLGVAHNFLATLGRHPLRSDECETPDWLPVDAYPRFAMLEHLLTPEMPVEAFRDGKFEERSAFVNKVYEIRRADTEMVELYAEGNWHNGDAVLPLGIRKCYTLRDESLTVAYTVTNLAPDTQRLRLGIELNACVTAGDAEGRTLVLHAEGTTSETSLAHTSVSAQSIDGVEYRDDWLGAALAMAWDRPAPCMIVPIFCPTGSLAGMEWVYQSTAVLPYWDLTLSTGADWHVQFRIRIRAKQAVGAGVTAPHVGNSNRGSGSAK